MVHSLSLRAEEPFVEVNCAAIPEELIESELFGHLKGSFTGALENKKGKFELADQGTLFLDEIGDMSLKTQAGNQGPPGAGRRPVGGAGGVRVDVRVLAATNKDLTAEIRAARFRGDLCFPPQRHSDFRSAAPRSHRRHPSAGGAFRAGARAGIRPPTEEAGRECGRGARRLRWPGNVREMRNVLGG
jgi:two-component system nitrogen regulation response regulator NtrX